RGMPAEEITVQADDRLVRAAIALARAAAEELTIDARRFMELGKNYMQPAERGDLGRELDVGAAPRHIGRDGDAARLAGARDDLRLFAVLARVEHDVLDAARAQQPVELLRCRHRARADQHR